MTGNREGWDCFPSEVTMSDSLDSISINQKRSIQGARLGEIITSGPSRPLMFMPVGTQATVGRPIG